MDVYDAYQWYTPPVAFIAKLYFPVHTTDGSKQIYIFWKNDIYITGSRDIPVIFGGDITFCSVSQLKYPGTLLLSILEKT